MMCFRCGKPLVFIEGRWLVHTQGDAPGVHCPKCGWHRAPYPSPTQCPDCGSMQVRDDGCSPSEREKT